MRVWFAVRVVAVCGLFGAVCLPAYLAAAHPADEIIERDTVHVRADGVAIEMTISAGVIKAGLVWSDVDTDNNKELSPAEQETYGAFLAAGYEMRVDGAALPMEYVPGSLDIATMFRTFQTQAGDPNGAIVRATFRAAIPRPDAPHDITLLVNHYNAYSNDRPPELYPVAEDGASVVAQNTPDFDLRLTTAPAPSGAAATVAPTAPPPTLRPTNTQQAQWLRATLDAPARGPLFAVLGLFAAVLLGALHALTPGHGKTMVAAYLVGSKGRVRDAVVLGGVVTLTHTGSVILLGIFTLLFTRAVVPDRVIPWIECVSGVLIAVLGASLLRSRLRVARAMPARPRVATAAPALIGASPGWHAHEDGIEHSHGFFGAHRHDAPPEGLSLRSLVLMGIGGGIVPCPDALAILLVAIAVGNIAYGLAVIFGFSIGLAVVLIALGIAIATTRVLERGAIGKATSSPWGRWIAPLSAALVLVIGCATLVRAILTLRH